MLGTMDVAWCEVAHVIYTCACVLLGFPAQHKHGYRLDCYTSERPVGYSRKTSTLYTYMYIWAYRYRLDLLWLYPAGLDTRCLDTRSLDTRAHTRCLDTRAPSDALTLELTRDALTLELHHQTPHICCICMWCGHRCISRCVDM